MTQLKYFAIIDGLSMLTKFLVYALIDPETLLVRYIGKSSSGLKRPNQHWSEPSSSGPYCRNWIKLLRAKGSRYIVHVLEYTSKAELNGTECWWIAYGRCLGWPLTNISAGGESNPLDVPETRAKWLAIMQSPEYRERRSIETKKLWAGNAELRAKHKASIGRGENSAMSKPGARQKVSDALKGKPKSQAHKDAIKATRTPELRARLGVRGDNHPAKNPAVKRKIGEASKLRWQDPKFREKVRQAKLRSKNSGK